jgi:hypothetical protein
MTRARNLILSGGIFHPFEKTSNQLAALFEPLGIDSTVTEDVEAGVADLSSYDLLTVNALRWRMQGEKYDEYRDEWAFSLSPEGRQSLGAFVRGGGGLIGVHTASICFDDWPEWGDMLGGNWIWGTSHHPPPQRFRVDVSNPSHPLTDGLAGFDVEDEVYSELSVHSDVYPLLCSSGETGAQPLAWSFHCGQGRVVYDALGHDEASIAQAEHARFLKRSALWVLGRSNEEVREA